MRVIKDNYHTMTVTCPVCKSILELSPLDIQGGDVVKHFYKCGACGNPNFLNTNEIPIPILIKLEQNEQSS
jgi:hypothetical protein